MKRLLLILLCTVAAACSPREEPLSLRMVRSEMARAPKASYLDGQGGNLKWNYTTGLELKAFLDVYAAYGGDDILDYVDGWYDEIIAEDGTIGGKYSAAKYNLDHICPARTLFALEQWRPKEKYAAAIRTAFSQLSSQPRTRSGVFWHKSIYPWQVWLDGLYMAEPFYAEMALRADADSLWSDIAHQFDGATHATLDTDTRLLRHAWDESRQMFWADPETGQSPRSWGRAMGWYGMALAEVLDVFPVSHPRRADLVELMEAFLRVVQRYADPETGMWYQVLDAPGEEGNYLEATCSAMFTYVFLKAAAAGWTDVDARAMYRSLCDTFLREAEDGSLSLIQCCAVAGLGGKEMRSGTYDYYIHEKIVENDPKGIGPFIWASLEYEKK